MRTLLRRPSLLTKFSVLSLLVIAALGIGVGSMLHRQIEDRALASATDVAEVMTVSGLQPTLLRGDLEPYPSLARLDGLDEQLRLRNFDQLDIQRMKLYSADGQVVYSDDRSLVGTVNDEADVRSALAGEVESDVVNGTRDDGHGPRSLEVYVPVRLQGAPTPSGVFEVYLPYEPVAEAIAADSQQLYVLLGGGLLLLYATLFRIVAVASRRLRHQALHDHLTDLPNRTLLYERMEDAIAGVSRGGGVAALLLIDLDRFKEVNDTLGHDHGDRLLEQVASRLREAVRRGDTLARLGGDEFAVLVRDVPHRGAIAEVATRLQQAMARPFVLNGFTAVLDASVGIAYCPDHGSDVHVLLQRADVAMYDAKRTRTGIQTYAEERDPYSAERLQLLGELREAIAAGELVLHYQPKVSLGATRRTTGVEALVRWLHPTDGLLMPAQFMPEAVRSQLIEPLTRWVLDTALHQQRLWSDAGLDLTMAVNISARSLTRDSDLPDTLAELSQTWGIAPGRLILELTENALLDADGPDILDLLHRMGARLAIDDFGTGHSSLVYLQRLPLDEVKIDRSFVTNLASAPADAVIASSTIDLAHNLGLTVVAEGAEDEATLEMLADYGCDSAQGFFFSQPCAAEELTTWLTESPFGALVVASR
jgi:diguanylate cyclase (GGDEF)-like protein